MIWLDSSVVDIAMVYLFVGIKGSGFECSQAHLFFPPSRAVAAFP